MKKAGEKFHFAVILLRKGSKIYRRGGLETDRRWLQERLRLGAAPRLGGRNVRSNTRRKRNGAGDTR